LLKIVQLTEFFKFFNVDVLLGDRISNDAIQQVGMLPVLLQRDVDCVPSWLTDFRDDLPALMCQP